MELAAAYDKDTAAPIIINKIDQHAYPATIPNLSASQKWTEAQHHTRMDLHNRSEAHIMCSKLHNSFSAACFPLFCPGQMETTQGYITDNTICTTKLSSIQQQSAAHQNCLTAAAHDASAFSHLLSGQQLPSSQQAGAGAATAVDNPTHLLRLAAAAAAAVSLHVLYAAAALVPCCLLSHLVMTSLQYPYLRPLSQFCHHGEGRSGEGPLLSVVWLGNDSRGWAACPHEVCAVLRAAPAGSGTETGGAPSQGRSARHPSHHQTGSGTHQWLQLAACSSYEQANRPHCLETVQLSFCVLNRHGLHARSC